VSQHCNRCSGAARFLAQGLCGACLGALGFHDEAAEARAAEATYAADFEIGRQQEHERLMAILHLPEAQGRTQLAIALCKAPSMDAAKALTMLAAAPIEEAVSGPAAEFQAELARCRGHVSVVENDVDDEDAYVRRQVARDERLLAERQTGSQEMANTPNTRRDP